MKMYESDNVTEVEDFRFWDDGSRNSDWFAEISGNGNFFKYNNFPRTYLWEVWETEVLPNHIKVVMSNSHYYGGYDFNKINVGDFLDWFEKMEPFKRAGFVDRYTLWKIENHWEIPDADEIPTYPTDECNIFTEYEYHDPSSELYKYLTKNDFPRENNIFYYFDH